MYEPMWWLVTSENAFFLPWLRLCQNSAAVPAKQKTKMKELWGDVKQQHLQLGGIT